MMTALRTRLAAQADDGFTLIEMVISFLILGIIIAPLASSYILGLGATTATAQSVANSSDAELLATYFTGDIASANSIGYTNAAPSGACAPGTQLLVQTQQKDLSSASAPTVYETYVVTHNVSAENTLRTSPVYEIDRVTCDVNGTVTGTTPLAQTVQAVPTVCDNTQTPAVCPPAAGAGEITIAVQEYEFGSYAPPKLSGSYSYSITGVRRVG